MEEVLCGDRPPDDAEFQRHLRDDPQLRARWDRMRALTSTLDELGSTQRSILASTGEPSQASEDRVAALVRAQLPRPARPRLVPHWVWLGVAAAGLALLLWTTFDRPAPEAPASFDGVLLGDGTPVLYGLTSAVLGEGAYRLAWEDAEQAFGRTYFVHFHERDGALIGTALEDLRSPELLDTHWIFTPPATLHPEHVSWSVEVRDASGNPVATGALQDLTAP